MLSNALGTKLKPFQHLILGTLSILFMRPHPLLAVVVTIIFHISEASQIFNKYFFHESHIDLGLFTQVYQASLREVIVLCFM